MAGQIKRLRLKGFMTYDELELIPSSGLNLIVGLNGSGKSSIMCAICLVLAGSPKFTGKSMQMFDFIKVGHKKAIIEIELENPNGRNIVIGRIINAEKSIWTLNNHTAQPSQVSDTVKKLNIDVGNLCQFLPQEKVVEFSKMDKKQRLENMLQAIGEPSLFKMFNHLKELRNEITSQEKAVEKLHQDQSIEQRTNEQLKTEVEKHEERLRLQTEVETLKLAKMVKQYELCREHTAALQRERDDLNRKKLRLEQDVSKLKTQQDSMMSSSNGYAGKVKDLGKKISDLNDMLSKRESQLADLHEQVDSAKILYRNRLAEKENQKTKLQELEVQIRALENQQENMKQRTAEINAQSAENSRQYDDIKQNLALQDQEMENTKLELNRVEYNAKGYENKINEISNEENKRMDLLRQRFRPTYDAVLWLQQNQTSFRSNICEPPLISIKVGEDGNRKFIENHVSLRDLLVLVCEDPADVQRLTSILREQKQLAINIALAPRESISNFVSPNVTPEMRKLGIRCFLKDLIVAPEPVMRYLCALYHLHKIPVCTDVAERNIETILQWYQRFFTPNEKITGKTSKYGNRNISVRRDYIADRKILPNFKDKSEELHAYERMMQEARVAISQLRVKYENFEKIRNALERTQEQLRAERSKLVEDAKRMNSIKLQLKQKKDLYNRKASEVVDEVAEKTRVTEKICRAREQEASILSSIHSLLKEYFTLKIQKAKNMLVLKFLREKLSVLNGETSELQVALQEITVEYNQKRNQASELKQQGKAMLVKIQAKYTEETKDKIKPILTNLPTLEEIERKLVNVQAQLDLNCEDYDAVLKEYKEREIIIRDVGLRIEDYQREIQRLRGEMQVKKTEWLPKLETHISNINNKFSKYYKCLECAGEISLDPTQDTDDFPKYGLQIRLKYRAEEDFMELSQTHHSGGECSVAAIIFILSLQELTEVPFRCIDEINQGMDANNERKIYDLIADASKSGSCSQYFLLTPKLLMDLNYHSNVAVHVIYNSPYLSMSMDLKKHLEKRRSLKK